MAFLFLSESRLRCPLVEENICLLASEEDFANSEDALHLGLAILRFNFQYCLHRVRDGRINRYEKIIRL